MFAAALQASAYRDHLQLCQSAVERGLQQTVQHGVLHHGASMTDNIELKDAFANGFWTRTKDVGDVSNPLHLPCSTPYDIANNPLFTLANPGVFALNEAVLSASFARPGALLTYASGQLIANDPDGTKVTPMSFTVGRASGRSGHCARARLTKSTTTTTNAIFRAHLYGVGPNMPDAAHGDGGIWLSNQAASYIGSFTFDMSGTNGRVFTDGARANAIPDIGASMVLQPALTSTSVFALLEARGAYAGGSAETFTLDLEVGRN